MDQPITSRHNPRVKRAAELRESRGRREQGRIVIDGVREIGRALEAEIECLEAFVCDRLLRRPGHELVDRLTNAEVEVVPVAESVFEKLAFGERSEGIIAVAQPPQLELGSLSVPDNSLIVVLEGIEKPGNVGAVLRTADAVGVTAVIVADGGTDLYNPNAIRASAGTIFSLPVVPTTSREAKAWLESQAFPILTARPDAARDYTAADLRAGVAIVLGSEAHGLTDIWRGDNVTAVKLPMRGAADSLNVSVTAAVILYEALRQRMQRDG